MATSYLTKGSKKKAAQGSSETPAKGGVEKKVSAKKKAAPKKTAAGVKKTASGGAKKTEAREVPKESRFRDMPVEEWMKEKTSGWQAQAIAKIMGLVKKAAPEATVSIKWGQPVFESNGPFAYIRPAKAHVTFGFWRGGEIADPKQLLDGSGDRMQHMKLAGLDQIDEKAITAMVKDAVRLNRGKGSPTIRSKG